MFETGIKLTREAQQVLSEAEQKVQMLREKNGNMVALASADGPHTLKTGALIRPSLALGAFAVGADTQQLAAILAVASFS